MNHSEDGSNQESPQYNSDLNTHKRFGVLLFVALFGFGGIWATTAPIDGAALAPGIVVVRSYSKVIQHLEGGIISNIFIENGTRLKKDDPILEIDKTQSLAQLEIANSQLIALRAREYRLEAERDAAMELVFPQAFTNSSERALEESDAQLEIFRASRSAIEASVAVLTQRIEQLESQTVGLMALKDSKEQMAKSFDEELSDIQELLEQGFSDKNRLRQLERNVASFEGEAAELTANIASTEVQIGETRLQIIQLEREFHNEVVTELSEVQTGINDTFERVTALEDIVSRTIVRAPESGIINGLQFHTVGGVINPGTRIVDIVPEEDDLIIEAQVSPNDIDRVAVNQNATIRFSTFGMGSVPTVFGTVINLSADSLLNETTNTSYYLARVEVEPESLESMGDLALMPGMPAEVFISTGSRTFLQYLLKPFSNAIARGFRED